MKKPEKEETVREEFKLPEKLARDLSDYAHLNKTKKVRVVIQALEKYFKDEQFAGRGGVNSL